MTQQLHQVRQPRMGVLRHPKNPDLWKRDGVIHRGMKELPEIQAILKAHDHRCYFCGFHDPLFIEPHHLNGDHTDHSEKNVVPACTLCHAPHHLFAISQNQSAIFGLFKDNITQTNLNHLQRLLLVLNHHQSDKIRAVYSRKGRLGSLCFDDPISLHERRRFTDFTDYDFQTMMLEDVKKYKEAMQRISEKSAKAPIGSEEEPLDLEVYFKGEFDDLEAMKRQPGEDDEVANERQVKFQEQLAEYKKWYRERMKNNKNFSVFQLAMALKECEEEAYKQFHFGHHNILLCFTENIFTPEQIEYYSSRSDFDISEVMQTFDAAKMIPDVDDQLRKMKVDLG